MKPFELFVITLKIVGLFLLKDLLFTFLQIASTFNYYFGSTHDDPIWTLIFLIIELGAFAYVVYLCLITPGVIIHRLKLHEGFTTDFFQIATPASQLLEGAIVIAGLYIFATEIPHLLQQAFTYIDAKKNPAGPPASTIPMVTTVVKILIGLLFLGERKQISAWLDKRGQKKEVDDAVHHQPPSNEN